MTKIAKAQGRSVKEWVGKSADDKPPPRVYLRVLRRQGGKCALSGILIADGQKFDLDHITRVEDGGENREGNLQAVLRLPHEIKTAAERKRQAKADRLAKAAHGLKPEGAQTLQSAGFRKFEKPPRNGAVKIDKSALAPLGPSNIARRFGQ